MNKRLGLIVYSVIIFSLLSLKYVVFYPNILYISEDHLHINGNDITIQINMNDIIMFRNNDRVICNSGLNKNPVLIFNVVKINVADNVIIGKLEFNKLTRNFKVIKAYTPKRSILDILFDDF